jgi:uncharacterized OB-fold protein
MKEAEFSKQGRVATFTVIRYPPTGFEKEAPYVVALIDLEDGPKVAARIIDNPNDLKIGSAVTYLGRRSGALEFKRSEDISTKKNA